MSDTDFQETNWDGTERRTQGGSGSLLSLLHYLEAKQSAHNAKAAATLAEHTVEEMERYREMLAGQKAIDAAAEKRHEEVMAQLSILAGRTDLIEASFAPDDKGKPDYSGHRVDHTTRKRFGEWLDGTKRGVASKLFEWAAVLLAAYVVYKVAPHLLGPVVAPGM